MEPHVLLLVEQVNTIQPVQLQKEFYKLVLIVQKDVHHVQEHHHVQHVAKDIVYQEVHVILILLKK